MEHTTVYNVKNAVLHTKKEPSGPEYWSPTVQWEIGTGNSFAGNEDHNLYLVSYEQDGQPDRVALNYHATNSASSGDGEFYVNESNNEQLDGP